ncbi:MULTISPECIES: flagellar basal body protein [unclassified Rhizobacter]|uniref:flagellar basal body protein n=1 Tax=unclassified Rhizobacter TaxID=2640088 RepID=UPI0006FC121F|nr:MULTISPECIES: flagellar basal body protein [unclassified Rhizobacter]KQU80752.1 flagellar basal body rod protein [Rhizobacter sp. Root29]KQW04295.1 flagellar basal body rod protein [Rhizobacter sp. Root1238]KRB14583.1 flagellar basal body rod protein [Rhizobacter sp. Root16D2]
MSNTFSIGLSGLNAAQLRLDSAAHNIANTQTAGFRRQQVVQQARPEGGVQADIAPPAESGGSLEADIVDQMSAAYSYKANLRTLQVQDEVLGSLLDATA